MMWYCAHAIFYFKLKYGEQDSYLVHENVYLIQASDEIIAMQKALKIARENIDVNEDNHLNVNEKPVRYLFAGIRKIISINNYDQKDKKIIKSGVEITYSEFEVDNLEQVDLLGRGEFVDVLYRE